jgi:DNA-binding phage protein
MNDVINENPTGALSNLDELSDINQKITFCAELLSEKLSTNSDPKILEIIKILDNTSVRLTDYVVSLRDELDK